MVSNLFLDEFDFRREVGVRVQFSELHLPCNGGVILMMLHTQGRIIRLLQRLMHNRATNRPLETIIRGILLTVTACHGSNLITTKGT